MCDSSWSSGEHTAKLCGADAMPAPRLTHRAFARFRGNPSPDIRGSAAPALHLHRGLRGRPRHVVLPHARDLDDHALVAVDVRDPELARTGLEHEHVAAVPRPLHDHALAGRAAARAPG